MRLRIFFSDFKIDMKLLSGVNRRLLFTVLLHLAMLQSNVAYSEKPSSNTGDKEALVAQQTASEAKKPAFNIWEYEVTGNTLLTTKQIEMALFPFMGTEKNLDTIQEATQSLEEIYRFQGFPTVRVGIPPQDIVAGKVKLEVIEGRVSRLRVTGSDYYSLSKIKNQISSVGLGEPMHAPSLQADITQLNAQSSKLRVTPVLKPGKAPGTFEVDLRVKDELPVQAGLETSNNNSKNTTRARMNLSLGYDNLWQSGHSWSLQYQTSPESSDEVKVFSTTYILPISNFDSRLALYAVHTDSEVSSLSDVAVIGRGNIYGFRYVKPLGSSRSVMHSLSLGIDYKDFDENIELLGADTSIDTPIDYSIFTGIYNLSKHSKRSSTKYGISGTLGLRGLFSTAEEDKFNDKRRSAKPNFFYLQAKINRQDRLDQDWRINTRLKMQLADSSLISNEQFSAGGQTSVRGYFESQNLGDHGVISSFALESPNFGAKLSKSISSARLELFVDSAYLAVKDAASEQEDEFGLWSVGLGTQWQVGKRFNFDLDLGVPMEEADDIERHDIRVHAKLGLRL